MVYPFHRSICRFLIPPFFLVMLTASVFAAPSTTPPPESTSKVKRVLLYNKIGGWVSGGVANIKLYMASLAQSKGFELDTLSDDASITLEFLKQYQVIVWNNNNNGAVSVPTHSAREAIIEYVNQGGGWFLIGLASDNGTWPALKNMLGASFAGWSNFGVANMQVDTSALKHPELRFVVNSLPITISLKEQWLGFDQTVRPITNLTVLYTAQGTNPLQLRANPAYSKDPTYVWARIIEEGKLLYCPSGWNNFQPSPLAQSDSAVAKLYWNSMRWLAGDFQNGCTDPTSPLFNPEARVDDGSCGSIALRRDRPIRGQGESRRTQHSIAMMASETTLLPSLAPSLINAENIQNRDIRGKWITNSRSMPSNLEGLNHEK